MKRKDTTMWERKKALEDSTFSTDSTRTTGMEKKEQWLWERWKRKKDLEETAWGEEGMQTRQKLLEARILTKKKRTRTTRRTKTKKMRMKITEKAVT